MQQVMDFFDILTDESNHHVVWNLASATTNSPLTVEGEPVDLRTHAGAFAQVQARIDAVEAGFFSVISGYDFDETFPREKLEIARRLINRSANGLGTTRLRFRHDRQPIEISRPLAKRYISVVVDREISLHSYLFARTSRKEVGSIEGRIVDIGKDYNEPAIQLKEQNSQRLIWCRINSGSEDRLAESMKARDVWENRRARVRGVLNYDNTGKVIRIFDGEVVLIDERGITLRDIKDPNLTESYTVLEYLDRIREGEFG